MIFVGSFLVKLDGDQEVTDSDVTPDKLHVIIDKGRGRGIGNGKLFAQEPCYASNFSLWHAPHTRFHLGL